MNHFLLFADTEDKSFISRGSGAFTFTGGKFTPSGLPTFFEEPEPPDIDSEEEDSDDEQ